MPSRLPLFTLFFLCLVLITILVRAQQGVARPTMMAQGSYPGVPPNFSHTPGSAFLVQRKTTAGKAGAPLSDTAQGAALNFVAAVSYGSGGQYATWVTVADVNGDGIPDVLVSNGCSADSNCTGSTVGVLLGNGNGAFEPAVTYDTGGDNAYSVAVADVNEDGKPDLIVANQCVSCASGTVAVLLGNGDGTFQKAMTFSSGGYRAFSVAVADVNLDGRPDLIVANYGSNNVGVLLGNGNGTFRAAVTYGSGGPSGSVPFSVAVADLNLDGRPDIVVANGDDVGVLLGNGDGTFEPVVTFGSGGGAYSIAVADVNGDGKPDIVVGNGHNVGSDDGSVSVLFGNGDGIFQTAVTYASGGDDANSVTVADVNGDGKPDLIVANYCIGPSNCANGTVAVLLGDGDGTFEPAVSYGSGGGESVSVAVADLNRDGLPDLVVANIVSNNVGVVINNDANDLGPTATAWVSSANPSNYGQSVTFTATVTAEVGGTPTGTVSFLDGNTSLGNSSLNSNSVATLSTSSLAVGTQSITVIYNGDTHFVPSEAPAKSQLVQGSVGRLGTSLIAFGGHALGISSAKTEALNNAGNEQMTVTSVTATGDFAVQANSCMNGVKPSTHCNVNVVFTPTQLGPRSGTLTFTDNASNSPQTAQLTGTGLSGTNTTLVSSLNPANFDQTVTFTATVAGQSGATPTGTVGFLDGTTSLGKSSLNSSGVATFTISTLSVETHSITATYDGDTQFAPSTSSILNQVVMGTVAVSPSTTSLSFGDQVINTTSGPKIVVLTNTGGDTLTIGGVTVDGNFAISENTCGATLAGGAKCSVKITFTPTMLTEQTGTITVADNAPNSPQTVTLTGKGEAQVVWSPTSMSFAAQAVGTTSAAKNVTLTNNLSTALGITSITFTGTDPGDYAQTNTCGGSVAAKGRCTISVMFTPKATGIRTGTLNVSDSANNSPQTVTSTGTGK
jgi:hypothetical protein